ncbi:hypothetical protein GCM10027562_07830 [Arthrobacter pigmenti]
MELQGIKIPVPMGPDACSEPGIGAIIRQNMNVIGPTKERNSPQRCGGLQYKNPGR